MEDGYDKAKRVALKQNPGAAELLLDARNVEEYAQSIKLMEEAQKDRDAYVAKLLKTIQEISSIKKESVKTQTDQACMNNAVTYDYVPEADAASSEESSSQYSSEVNPREDKMKRMMASHGITVDGDSSDESDGELTEDEEIGLLPNAQ